MGCSYNVVIQKDVLNGIAVFFSKTSECECMT